MTRHPHRPRQVSWLDLAAAFLLAFPAMAAGREILLDPGPPGPEARASRANAGTRSVTVWLPEGEDVAAYGLEPGGAVTGSVTYEGSGTWRGHRLASFTFPNGSTLRLQLAPASATDVVRRLRHDAVRDRRDLETLAGLVANPEDLRPVASPHKGLGSPARGFRPSAYPDLEGSPVAYLIVTSSALAADFQVLADWKTRRGVPAVVRTLDWVEAHARRGSDPAETLRNFLQDAYALWGVDWVLLGGDTDVVPTRFAYSNYSSQNATLPTDHYFACLDGSWNANGNDRWGQAAASASDLGDQADLYPEIYVARAPVRSSSEAQLFIQKTIGYETPLATDYQNQALFLAEVLSPANYDSGMTVNVDGAALSETIRTTQLPPSLDLSRQYETYFAYPGSSRLRKSSALAALGAGPNLVNHMGHGYRYNMSLADASLVNAEAEALANGNRTFIMFLLNCTALAFDSNSLGERFLLAPGGGAVGVVGSSREAYPNNSIEYNKNFYKELFTRRNVHLAQAVANARLARTAFTFFDSQDRWTHFILNTIGDPQLTIFTGPAIAPVVTYVDSVDLDAVSLQVHVEASAAPAESIVVCAWKGDESYATGLTNANGDVTLPLDLDTPGTLLVTASERNLRTHLGSVVVRGAAPPHLRLASVAVVDDGSGASAGNGDGRIDAGETVELEIEVENNGGAGAAAIHALLVSPSGAVSVLQDSFDLGDLEVGPPAAATGRFVVQAAAGIADGSTFEFEVQFADSAGTPFGSVPFGRVVHAPRPEVVEVLPLPAGPTTTFGVVLQNFGGGELPVVTVALTSSDPDVTVDVGATAFAPISSFATGTSLVPLVVTEANTSQRNRMRLDFTDAWGRASTFEFDLRGPVAAAKPVLDAREGPTSMRLTWSPSADADLFGYHVYRRLSGSGSLVRVSPNIVHASYYLDTGLQPSTRYDYAVAAVDSSRQVGALSATATASTNPPQLAGWPLVLPAATASSVALGDIDGDGDLEILVGDDGIYAWHHDGTEVRDGDGNAVTWGALTASTSVVAAALALGDLDPGTPGLEIVAAHWADNLVYAYDHAGNVLPGWPRQPSNGGAAGYWGTPTVADLDGDGSPEVLAISKDGRLYGWRANGTPLAGSDGSFGVVGAFTRTSPTVVNLDGDPQLEIVVAGSDGFARAYEMNGSVFSLGIFGYWPVNLGAASLSSPAVGEIDGNPATAEIVFTSENDRVHVLSVYGYPLPGWPKTAPMDSPSFGPSPAVGDLNGDGRDEIVVVSNKNPSALSTLIVYDGASGAILLQRLLGNISESSPILADADGDGSIDVIVGGESGIVNAWNLAGAQLDGFPLTTGDFVRSTPTFADVDGDGDAELVLAGWNRNVYVWDLQAAFVVSRAPWPTFCQNAGRTGNPWRHLATDTRGDGLTAVPAVFRLYANVPNPFNPSTRIRLDVPVLGWARLAVFDARGRLVRELYRGELATGRHHFAWDGRDARGGAVPSGVYWYRAETGAWLAAHKMVLVR